MLIATKILNSSDIYSLSSSAYELLPGILTGDQYELDKIVYKFRSGSITYDFPTGSVFRFVTENLRLIETPSILFNNSSSFSDTVNQQSIFTGSLNLLITGSYPSGPTIGDGTLQFDIYYNIGNLTQKPVTQFEKITRGSIDNQALADFSSAEGYNTTAGSKYSISTTIVSGSASPIFIPSYVDVPGIVTPGTKILLDDSIYDNIYGKIILDVDSYIGNVGPPETTTIYLTNPTIQTSTASIYLLGSPRIGNSISGSYSHTDGYNTNTIGEYSHAEGDSTIAIGNSSHASGIGTIAFGTGQTVTGKYNLFNNSDLFIIGNGVDDTTRSNIVAISDTTVSITGSLNVSTDINANLTGTASWAQNAVTAATASYVLNGVTQIIAGTNISISPTSGTGSVTINSTGGGSVSRGFVIAMAAAM